MNNGHIFLFAQCKYIVEIGVGLVFAFWIYVVRAHSDADGKNLYDLLFAITIYPIATEFFWQQKKNEM